MFRPFYEGGREAAISHARELGFAIFASGDQTANRGREVFAAKTVGTVGRAAGARDQLFVLAEFDTGYADWRVIRELAS